MTIHSHDKGSDGFTSGLRQSCVNHAGFLSRVCRKLKQSQARIGLCK